MYIIMTHSDNNTINNSIVESIVKIKKSEYNNIVNRAIENEQKINILGNLVKELHSGYTYTNTNINTNVSDVSKVSSVFKKKQHNIANKSDSSIDTSHSKSTESSSEKNITNTHNNTATLYTDNEIHKCKKNIANEMKLINESSCEYKLERMQFLLKTQQYFDYLI
ncbi:hypothetical protein BMW23_1087 [Bodo saltans virus]|uniref:Uncharacterized protein n=1 Tax=Bodo saltans virus TaxID=2024608 RepID=A0A2H4UW26_9VIRU|nr:hypothetical protein QJ851_gp1068 [Bodo saltans virus]ATZ81131.1 hypothetical protein BMW23_1087 [Bodo saltans virus]